MLVWTMPVQASMCCMLAWMQACQRSVALAGTMAGPAPAKPHAEVLPFPADRVARSGGSSRSATIIPLGRLTSRLNG